MNFRLGSIGVADALSQVLEIRAKALVKINTDRAETSDLSIEWRKERAGGNLSRFSAPLAV
jgi:hypothetical protein